MRRLPVFAGAIASLMLLAYLFVEAAAPDLPTALVSSVERRTLASFGGVVILAADCLLPVPASAVMILHGAIFGVAAGTMYSFVGAMIAALQRSHPRGMRLIPTGLSVSASDRSRSVSVVPLAVSPS